MALSRGRVIADLTTEMMPMEMASKARSPHKDHNQKIFSVALVQRFSGEPKGKIAEHQSFFIEDLPFKNG